MGSVSRWRERHIVRKTPDQNELAFLAGAAVGSAVDRVRSWFYRDQWFLALRRAGEPNAPFSFLMPDTGRFYADPFLHQRDEKTFLFFEELPFASGQGHIAVVEIAQDGKLGTPQPALQRPYHLSYPFVFDWRGDTYMIPESLANRTVEMYRARNYPCEWEPVTVLLKDISAADATLVEHGGRWWMFANVARPGEYICDYLHLWWADSPLGPWQAHPRNPIVHDRSGSRPAGALFRRGDLLLRPAQDCASEYGGAIVLKQVDCLTEQDYAETPAGRIEPSMFPGARRVHTVNRTDQWEVYDVFRWVRGPRETNGRGSAR